MKRITVAALVVASLGVLVACGDDRDGRNASSTDGSSTVTGASASPTDDPTFAPGDGAAVEGTAIWSVEPHTELTAESRSFTALVMRLGCHGGKSAPVDGPVVMIDDAEVVVTFTADPALGAQTCPGNDLVPVSVDLGEPIGDRRLLDGACLPGSPALATAYCPADGDRRAATAFGWLENGPMTSVPAADLLGAYCEAAAALAGERPEAYVGSQQHRADVYRSVALAPPELTSPLITFVGFLSSGAVDPADPDSNLTENWPDEVQTAIDTITAFNTASC